MDQSQKRIFQDLLDRFQPLTEAEQKDLLCVIFTRLDYYSGRKSLEAMNKTEVYSSILEMLMTRERNSSLEWALRDK